MAHDLTFGFCDPRTQSIGGRHEISKVAKQVRRIPVTVVDQFSESIQSLQVVLNSISNQHLQMFALHSHTPLRPPGMPHDRRLGLTPPGDYFGLPFWDSRLGHRCSEFHSLGRLYQTWANAKYMRRSGAPPTGPRRAGIRRGRHRVFAW
jgi:hypothetical protein